MPRIATPASIDAAPAAAKPLLEAVQRKLGSVPNLFRVVANSPAALEGYLQMSGALDKGTLPAKTRERIALAVAEINGCNYCLAAHSYIASAFHGLDAGEIAANRSGQSADPKADAAVRFAARVVRERGHVAAGEVESLRHAGYDDGQIVEIVQHVALNTWTNYLNEVAGTVVDFPAVDRRAVA
ncbi:MAG: carboxymuconolactone decarboxylase family protein [Labrys sp. (in: a-proteobacteria)]